MTTLGESLKPVLTLMSLYIQGRAPADPRSDGFTFWVVTQLCVLTFQKEQWLQVPYSLPNENPPSQPTRSVTWELGFQHLSGEKTNIPLLNWYSHSLPAVGS